MPKSHALQAAHPAGDRSRTVLSTRTSSQGARQVQGSRPTKQSLSSPRRAEPVPAASSAAATADDASDRLPAAKVQGILSLLEDTWSATNLESFQAAVLHGLANRLGYLDAVFVTGVAQPDGATIHRALGSGCGKEVALDFSVRWRSVESNPETGKPVTDEPGRELALLDETLRDNGVGDRVAVRFPTPAGIALVVALVAPERRRFKQADRAVLSSLGSHLSIPVHNHVTRHLDLTSVARLSPLEQDVVRAVAKGCSNAQVAATLCLSVHTVKQHVTRAMRAVGCENRTQLALVWHRSVGSLLPWADILRPRDARA